MDATGEILKSGALTNATDLLKQLAGPAFEEFGAILGDKLRVYRIKNLIRTTEKTKRILQEAGLTANAVPSRLLLPIIETCAVEDDEDIQELWAGLLASASQESSDLSPSFIETLKQVTPDEAKHWNKIYEKLLELNRREPRNSDSIPYSAFTAAWHSPPTALETFERLGLIAREYDVKLDSRTWGTPLDDVGEIKSDVESALDGLQAEIRFQLTFTSYALRFTKACRGPHS